jgi:4-alpha-glucanotransferase
LKKFAAGNTDYQKKVEEVYFVQYHLHRQLQMSHQYALEKGVIFKGDVPIGIYRHSADAWQQPELYHMNRQAGAPPDDFAVKGQNWGFPTYNWSHMAADGYQWWQRRFEQMRNYYDAFRIDHILGFFRIWSIPMDAVEGIMGYFEPAIPITKDELLMRGLPLDLDRYTQPFTDFLYIKQLFGADAQEVLQQFFDAPQNGIYPLKPAFATQQQVAHYFDALENTPHHQKIKAGLMDVISNVLLFEVGTETAVVYHCRFHMERTHSFKSLPVWQQTRMRELYNNYFFERQDEMWQTEALQKLPALKFATDMLVCGEDLGLVPACVPNVMHRTGLLSLEVQRMPKDPGVPFLDLDAIPYLSVATPASHDTSTIRGWWEEPETDRETLYHNYLKLDGPPQESATGALVQAVIEQHLQSPAMWAIFQLQDWLGMDEALRFPDVESERINVPANPKHYWRYRFHLDIENLAENDEFSTLVRKIVKKSERA